MRKLVYFRLAAKNDVNGNPRRCFVVRDADTGELVACIDEGYAGDTVRRTYPGAVYLGSYESTPREIRDTLREGREAS